jgi:hypothetical protein
MSRSWVQLPWEALSDCGFVHHIRQLAEKVDWDFGLQIWVFLVFLANNSVFVNPKSEIRISKYFIAELAHPDNYREVEHDPPAGGSGSPG